MKLWHLREHMVLMEQLQAVSKQQAVDKGMFGPVYHGTTQDNLGLIKQEGFKVIQDLPQAGGVRNGYPMIEYGNTGLPPPIHHLGYGVYFTTAKAIAKNFAGGTTKGMLEFYLDVPRLEEINFGAPHTMMKWWVANGYDLPSDWTKHSDPTKIWIQATLNLTKQLASNYDAVWYKGKSLRKLLDGDQVCVYDPRRIYYTEPSLAQPMDIGSRVKHIGHTNRFNIHGDPMGKIPPGNVSGVILDKRSIPSAYLEQGRANGTLGDKAQNWIAVRWSKGGTDYNYTEDELVPVVRKGQ